MLFQTILDPSEVLLARSEEPLMKIQEKRLENRVVFGVEYNGRLKITQLFSTDPADYLNPRYQIGNLI